MGFYFRKSIGVGPFRVNLSKSGVGYSVGSGGLRVGRSARGRNYTTFNVPGSGLGYRTSSRAGCALLLAAGAALTIGGIGVAVCSEFFA